MSKKCPICDGKLHYNDDELYDGFWACDVHGMVIFEDTQIHRVDREKVCEICGDELNDLHHQLDDLDVCEACYEHETEDTIQEEEEDIEAIWLGGLML